MTPKRRIGGELQTKIEGWALDGLSTTQIEALLDEERIPPSLQPSRRTIQRIVQAAQLVDQSGPWSLSDAKGDEAQYVLSALRAYLNITAKTKPRPDRPWFITKAQARWVVRVARAAPGLDNVNVYRIARAYLAREARKKHAYDLDAMLAFTPWDDTVRKDRRGTEYTKRAMYRAGVEGGTIPPAPHFLMMEVAGIPWSMKSARGLNLFERASVQHDPDAYDDASIAEVEDDGETR